jgi:hypothetical protein
MDGSTTPKPSIIWSFSVRSTTAISQRPWHRFRQGGKPFWMSADRAADFMLDDVKLCDFSLGDNFQISAGFNAGQK